MLRVSEVLLFAKFVANFTGKRQVNMKWNLLITIFSQVCFENYLGSNKSYGLSIQVTPWKSCDEFQIASLHDWNRTFLSKNIFLLISEGKFLFKTRSTSDKRKTNWNAILKLCWEAIVHVMQICINETTCTCRALGS